MRHWVKIGKRLVGEGQPTYIVAEIGINHNGSLETALQLVDAAKRSGCNAVKFQKRTPEICTPESAKDRMRETPWGYISYVEYRKKIELSVEDYRKIDRHCRRIGMTWFASCWDIPSVDLMLRFDVPCLKIPSACLTDKALLKKCKQSKRPVILSTGMSDMKQIAEAVNRLNKDKLIIVHTTSAYPCPVSELNLKVIPSLAKRFDCPIGYSGHEAGLPATVAAVALGACLVERHITLDRAMWGSDQAASVEPVGFTRLVKYIKIVEQAMGDGIKRVYDSERPAMRRLRKN